MSGNLRAALICALLVSAGLALADRLETSSDFVVQGPDLEVVRAAVLEVGGNLNRELWALGAVDVSLTRSQLRRLRQLYPDLRVALPEAITPAATDEPLPSPTVAPPRLASAESGPVGGQE